MAKQSLFNRAAPASSPSAAAAPATTETSLAVPFGTGMMKTAAAATRPDEASGPSNPYVTHINSKSDKWADYSQQFPGLQSGDAILVHPDRDPVRMTSLTFYLLDYYRYFAQLNPQDFSVSRAWPDSADADAMKKLTPRVHETVSALILVSLPDGGIVPATYRVSDGMTQGMKKAFLVATEETDTDGWFARSNDHAVSKKIDSPNLRAKFTLTWSPTKSKASGYTYFTSKLSVAATTVGDFLSLTQQTSTEESKADYQNALESFTAWVERVGAKIV